MNQNEFADECGISSTLVSLIETGKENVTIDTLQLLSSHMGVSLSELFNHNQVTYFVFPSTEKVEEFEYATYGIGALCDNTMITYISDISNDYNKVKILVELCNSENLSLDHLYDIAEDAVLEYII